VKATLTSLHLVRRFERLSPTPGALRIDARQRINGMMADRIAFPIRIKVGGVAILGEYHGHLECEHADGSFVQLGQTVLRPNRIGEPRWRTINTDDQNYQRSRRDGLPEAWLRSP
jgi:hypothetical protein